VSSAALRKATRRAHILDPGPGAVGLLWARGSPARIIPALEHSDLAPVYVTTPEHIRENGSVVAVERSYQYVRVIGAGAGVLSLLALLLYLGARQRTQLIATALARRMGLSALRDAAALALEAGAIVLVSAGTGALVAVLTAVPVIEHVDPLALYAPAPAIVIPWTTIAASVAVATAAGMLLGAAAGVIAAREDVAEALRVV
jgi:putative ABC transport system permease protein